MKAILLVGTVGLFTAPAVAGGIAKPRDAKKPAPVAATTAAAAAHGELVPLAIPELPPDPSSPLVPFPELETKRPVAPVKAARPAKTKLPVRRFGEDYVLGRRQSARPTNVDVEHVVPRELTHAQVATVVQSHISEIQVCWAAVPKHLRADTCTVDLVLTIADTGAVTDIALAGDVSKHAHKCITSAASHWTFPAAETSTEIEYGVALRSL